MLEVLEKKKSRFSAKKLSIIIISAFFALLVIALVCIYIFAKPDFKFSKDASFKAEAGTEFSYPECKVRYIGISMNNRLKKTSDVNTSVLGDYTATYSIKIFGKKFTESKKIKVCDTVPPVISYLNEEITVSTPALFTDSGTTAVDTFDGDVTETVTYEIISENGEFFIQYKATDKSGNIGTAKRKITVTDVVPPTIKLVGGNEITVSTPKYTEKGYSAFDDADGNITKNVTVTTDYVTGKEGTFTYNYSVSDSAGNTSTATRIVHVKDSVAPVITLNGQKSLYLKIGETYTEHGAYAVDAFEGDKTSAIVVTGTPDTSAAGDYTIEYAVCDSKGNYAKVTRKVLVYDPDAFTSGFITGNGTVSASTVYLTFDDGPSASVTPRVLDILSQNGVKATFFIVNYNESTKPLIARMISEGHTIGIHGYSHDYSVYGSAEKYMNNILTLKQKLIDDFGYNTNIIRFLGGSSNTVSKKQCVGVMTELCGLVETLGYNYFDWNVSSGDAAGNNVPSATIIKSVESGLKKGRANVVLMHDNGGKSTTADSLQSIINYCNANGYTFAGLSSNSPTVHHNVQN